LDQGVPARSILLFTPQRSLASPFLLALRQPGVLTGGMVDVFTMGGFAQRMVDLFWPLASGEAGFSHPNRLPTFLNLETAQYYMAHLVSPLLDQGWFESLVIDRNRLYSQILDNLHKAALVGFPCTEIGERLASAWMGDSSQKRVYQEVQECANLFRRFCLAHNLLDFSLQMEVFWKHVWPIEPCRSHLNGRYAHLVVDNVEEDTPRTHDFLRHIMPEMQTVLLVCDTDGGYRLFLGADPHNASLLREMCQEQIVFDHSFVNPPGVQAVIRSFARPLGKAPIENSRDPIPASLARRHLVFEVHRFHPTMIEWVADRIHCLVAEEGIPAGQIAILAPYMGDALRFSLMNRLEAKRIPFYSHRPSRALRDEPAIQCLLTLASLGHPFWKPAPSTEAVATSLMQSIEGMDLVRAQLLTGIVYRVRSGFPSLSSFDQIQTEMRNRITYQLGERYESLRLWLEEYRIGSPEPVDLFISRVFGEVLSQKGFGFHNQYDAGAAAARLIESMRRFRWVVGDTLPQDGFSTGINPADDTPLGVEYMRMVQEGVISAQYTQVSAPTGMPPGLEEAVDAVFISPATTFLMRNQPVEVQFWLDVGGLGWWERLNQPLTHPYVLSRSWPCDRGWTDTDEYNANQDTLYRLVVGLLRRCRSRIYLGISEVSEQGFQQQGPLLRVLQQVLRRMPVENAERPEVEYV